MQTSGSQCCTHKHTEQTWASSAFPPRKNSQDTFPALTPPSSSTAMPGLRLFLWGTEFSPRELPKHSHLVHTAKLWSSISAQTSAHQQSISHHCVRGHVLKKSYILWSKRQGETGDSGYLGFWLAGNTTFFSFFWHEHCADRWQRGRRCSKYMQLMEKYAFFWGVTKISLRYCT